MFVENWNLQESVQKRAIFVIERNSKLYLDNPSQSIFIIDLNCANCHLSKLDIYITLRIVKFDYPYTVSADDFCISVSVICTIIQNSIPKLSSYLQKLVQWNMLAENTKPFAYNLATRGNLLI